METSTPPADADAQLAALGAALDRRPARPSPWPLDGRVQAAVCVPLHFGSRGLEVWAIKRAEGMRHHAREIAFPGGKPDPVDAGLADTALRELEEELGVARARVRLLGALAPVPTATSRFTLNPFVAVVAGDAVARPRPAEVAALIRMPVRDFFAGRVPYRAVALAGGLRSPIFDFEAGSMYGASAHVMEEVLLACAEASGLPFPEPTPTDRIPWQ
jgi:8-oxo-dGTP pyrophosphatase MutT (NUDIX family)